MPEGDSELPDDGLPEDVEDADEDDSCPKPSDIFKARTESLNADIAIRE